MATFYYPYQSPVPGSGGDTEDPRTLAIDYVYFHRHRLNTNANASENYFFSRQQLSNGPNRVTYDRNACYIAIPGNVQTSYGPAYRRMDLGGMGVALTNLIGEGKDMSKVADILTDAAQAALPEFSTATAVQMANSFNAYLGLSGSTNINAISQMNDGRIFNPFSEQVFSGMSFRTHNFAFKMLARNKKEAEQIYKICDYMKGGAIPALQGAAFDQTLINKNSKYKKMNPKQKDKGNDVNYEDLDYKRKSSNVFDKDIFQDLDSGYARNDRYMSIPDRYDIRFVRMREGENGKGGARSREIGGSPRPREVLLDREDIHFKIFPSICTGIQVNYTPDGTYVARKQVNSNEIDVPAVVLSCSFVETRLLTKEQVQRGY